MAVTSGQQRILLEEVGLWEERDQQWMSNPSFPYDSVVDMIAYMRKTPNMKWALNMMVVDENGGTTMPQSYAHWWCHSRKVFPKKWISKYATIEKWSPSCILFFPDKIIINDSDVIAMLKTWIDMIRLDIRLYNDEGYRKGMPRLTKDQTIEMVEEARDVDDGPTRMDTLAFIIEECTSIFSERGWLQGMAYWQEYVNTI